MKWLAALEIENDPITTCRLMNTFRRKGVKIVTMAMAARPEGFCLMAVLDTPEGELEHIFHFLRCTEGVEHVTFYRHDPTTRASFVFADAEPSSVARFLQTFPESRLIFASQRKHLLEVPAESGVQPAAQGFHNPEFLPFAQANTTYEQLGMNVDC